MNYKKIKKLDEDSLQNLQEGTGPVDECICSILSPPDPERKSLGASIKKAFASITPGKKKKNEDRRPEEGKPEERRPEERKNVERRNVERRNVDRRNVVGGLKNVDVPFVFSKAEPAGIRSTKEVVKRKSPCGKCGCDKENIVLKHSYANIRITSPDVSSICSCPTDCLPDKHKLMNNIKVTVEHLTIDPDSENSEASLNQQRQKAEIEPTMSDKMSVTRLIDAQYDNNLDDFSDR